MSAEVATTQLNEFGIELTKAKTIESAFEVTTTEKTAYLSQYNEILTKEITPELVKEARELRLKLVKTRTNIASIHKAEKAFYLASGKYIDALKNKLTEPVEQAEEKLFELENYYINLEKLAKEQRTIARLERVSKFKNDVQASQISELEDETFEILLAGYEKAYNDAIEAENKRIEAERLEAKRIEKERLEKEAKDKAEREAQAKENARLKAENDRIAELARKEKQELEAKAKADREEAEKKAEAQRKENERIQKELEAKNKAESDRLAKEKADKEAEEKARLEAEKAPLKNKMQTWVNSFSLPETTVKNESVTEIKAKFEAYKAWALKEISKF